MKWETLQLETREGPVDAVLVRPDGAGPLAGVAVGAEATGINAFIRGVAAGLCERDYVVIIPDYYRRGGPPDPENYEDIDGIMRHVADLDFRRAVLDIDVAVDHLRARPDVDPSRVCVWGYCTGATLTGFVACLRPDLAAAVCFYPSQPTFDDRSPKRPVDLMDLLWAVRCPLFIAYGDQDVVMPADRLAELRTRLATWGVDHTLAVYPGAGHAFSAPSPLFHHQEAHVAAERDAFAFIARSLMRISH